MTNGNDVPKCAAQHFGPWLIEPKWFAEAVESVRSGAWQAKTPAASEASGRSYAVDRGIAHISIQGQMQKGDSSFGGASTIRVRRQIREAVNDDSVEAILLRIDSPGGTVAGTFDLADDIVAAKQVKPIVARIEDLGASAAYAVASAASRVVANETALIGSIGVLMVLYDTSGQFDKAGIKVHKLTTGDNKAVGVPGAEITDEQIKIEQQLVNDLGEKFVSHVNTHRNTNLKLGESAADGRVFMAADALSRGLIDSIETLDQTIISIRESLMADKTIEEQAAALKQDQPELHEHIRTDGYASGTDEGYTDGEKAGREAGHAEGYKSGVESERNRFNEFLEAFGKRPEFVVNHFGDGKSASSVMPEYVAMVEDENAKLQEQAASATADAETTGQAPVEIILEDDAEAEAGDKVKIESIADPEERATAEWNAMGSDEKGKWRSERVFVAARKRELKRSA